MKKSNRLRATATCLMLGALAGLLIGSFSFAEIREYDATEGSEGIQGRDYHQRLYQRGRCEACHAVAEPTGYPADGSCLDCHRMNGLVAATAPEDEEEKWQNPHDSLHYGREVPCVECHGEHTNKEPLCADCHNFEYPNHQY